VYQVLDSIPLSRPPPTSFGWKLSNVERMKGDNAASYCKTNKGHAGPVVKAIFPYNTIPAGFSFEQAITRRLPVQLAILCVTGRKCENIGKEASKINNGVIACLGKIARTRKDGINQAYI
jgi:hypothetical protein